MKDQSLSIATDNSLIEMTEKLGKWVKGYAKDRARLRALVLFEERIGKKIGESKEKSQVYWHDGPEIEMILFHRDQVLAMGERIMQCQDDCNRHDDFLERTRMMEAIAELDQKRFKHLEAIEKLLAQMGARLVKQEATMAKIATDAAVLAQKAYEHRDKMEIAKKGGDILPAVELKKRLALKYQISEDEVENMLSAKVAEVTDVAGE